MVEYVELVEKKPRWRLAPESLDPSKVSPRNGRVSGIEGRHVGLLSSLFLFYHLPHPTESPIGPFTTYNRGGRVVTGLDSLSQGQIFVLPTLHVKKTPGTCSFTLTTHRPVSESAGKTSSNRVKMWETGKTRFMGFV